MRGEKEDFDAWQADGLPGWGWQDVLPYYIKSETAPTALIHDRNERRGIDGPIKTELRVGADQLPGVTTFRSACQQLGLPSVADHNGQQSGSDRSGVSLLQFNTVNARRYSPADAYLVPASSRSNLHILTHTHVTRLLFDEYDNIAKVVFRRGRTANELRVAADEEVTVHQEALLSAGTFASPQLLMLSGIGDAMETARLGIPCVSHQPAVGQHLQDHVYIPLLFASKEQVTETESEADTERLLAEGRGPLTAMVADVTAFMHSEDSFDTATGKWTQSDRVRSEGNDIQLLYGRAVALPHYPALLGFHPDTSKAFFSLTQQHQGHIVFTSLNHPLSEGSVKLRTADPFDAPIIDPRLLSNPKDTASLTTAARIVEHIVSTPAFREQHAALLPSTTDVPLTLSSILAPSNPFDKSTQSSQWWGWLISHLAQGLFHPIGTCRMGADSTGSVCDAECRVRGVRGVRVVDGSVLPRHVCGNMQATVVMIAERAADWILNAARAARAPEKVC